METTSALTWSIVTNLAFHGTRERLTDRFIELLERQKTREHPEREIDEALSLYCDLALRSWDLADLAELARFGRYQDVDKSFLRKLYIPRLVNVRFPALDQSFEGPARESVEGSRDSGEDDAWLGDAAVPIADRIRSVGHVVVWGDPGAGKTSLIRWLATAFLLRLRNDPDLKELPCVEMIPEDDLVPMPASCSDLNREDLAEWLLYIRDRIEKETKLSPELVGALQAGLRKRFEEGKAILLFDGVDKITDHRPGVFLHMLIERFVERFPRVPIVMTSRPGDWHGLQLMTGRFFENLSLADPDKAQKDGFARAWCEIASPKRWAEERAEGLIEAIHGSDRMESLTGNPMMLAMLALIKARGGRTPSNRAELCDSAIRMLVDSPNIDSGVIDRSDAFPQLEYLACAMWRGDLFRIRESWILETLERLWDEQPDLQPVRDRNAAEFFRLVKRRTKILVECGKEAHDGERETVYEFQHAIFRDYLAGRALADGLYEGCDRSKPRAERIAALTNEIKVSENATPGMERDAVAKWIWPLRVFVASCSDSEVDDVLLGILESGEETTVETVAPPQVVLAALCLAEEPRASEGVADKIIRELVKYADRADRHDFPPSLLLDAVADLSQSKWGNLLCEARNG